MPIERFPIRVGRRSLPLLRLLWGVKPEIAYLEIGAGPEGELLARFGRVTFRTQAGNVDRWRIEGPFLWVTAIGVRRSIRHGDLSFAGSPHGGLRMDFRDPVRWWRFRIPALYVGVDDLDGLAGALGRRGIPVEDARKGSLHTA
jgi:hypothetical protein